LDLALRERRILPLLPRSWSQTPFLQKVQMHQ